MDFVHFALGLYGFSGSILLIIFYIWPNYKKKGKNIPFFGKQNLHEDHQFYKFYGALWSFRLISTGFLIRLLYSLELFENPKNVSNAIFIIVDILILLAAALNIYRVEKGNIFLEHSIYLFNQVSILNHPLI